MKRAGPGGEASGGVGPKVRAFDDAKLRAILTELADGDENLAEGVLARLQAASNWYQLLRERAEHEPKAKTVREALSQVKTAAFQFESNLRWLMGAAVGELNRASLARYGTTAKAQIEAAMQAANHVGRIAQDAQDANPPKNGRTYSTGSHFMLAAMVELALAPLKVEISQGYPFLNVLHELWNACGVTHGDPKDAVKKLIEFREASRSRSAMIGEERDSGTLGAIPSESDVELFSSWAVLVLGHSNPRLP